jgi:fluoroquinolone transport system permease protein
MRSLRLVPALLRPTVRAMSWWPLLLAGCLSLALLEYALTRPIDAAGALLWLRVSTVLGLLGAAFLLDDPTEASTESVPGSLLLRRAVRIGLLLPVVAGWWAVAAWRYVHHLPGFGPTLPGLMLEAAALLAVALALSAGGAARAPERTGGVVAAPALLAAVAVAWYLPERMGLFVRSGTGWDSAHQRWAVVLAAAALGFLAASRDPGRVRRVRIPRVARPAAGG